ncbi:STAS domain-containing protein [Candidatus Woesearchaeota archaeon]|nr:STAS domain-containing protein [Candidatus Woesearchaeota archaeon]
MRPDLIFTYGVHKKEPRIHRLSLEGYVTSSTVPTIEETLKNLLKCKHVHLIIDMERAYHVSPSGWHAFVLARTGFNMAGGEISLYRVQPVIRMGMESIGYDLLLPVYQSLRDAINANLFLLGVDPASLG